MCSREDSNLYLLRDMFLRHARIPIPPRELQKICKAYFRRSFGIINYKFRFTIYNSCTRLKINPHSLYKKMRNLSIYNFLWTGYRRASGSVAFISALNSIAISKCLISYESKRGAKTPGGGGWRWGGWWRINDIICNANNRKS